MPVELCSTLFASVQEGVTWVLLISTGRFSGIFWHDNQTYQTLMPEGVVNFPFVGNDFYSLF